MLLTTLLASYFVLWTFEPTALPQTGGKAAPVRDVLEVQTKLGGPWVEIPGPYHLSPDRLDVKVNVGNEGIKFFRIRRNWGEPWIFPNEINSKNP